MDLDNQSDLVTGPGLGTFDRQRRVGVDYELERGVLEVDLDAERPVSCASSRGDSEATALIPRKLWCMKLYY